MPSWKTSRLNPALRRIALLGTSSFALFFSALFFSFSCERSDAKNPTSLWINYAQSELHLVLVDHEPPPF